MVYTLNSLSANNHRRMPVAGETELLVEINLLPHGLLLFIIPAYLSTGGYVATLFAIAEVVG